MEQAEDILFDVIPGHGGDIAHITLNRPRALNALTHAMINAMDAMLRKWQKDETIKAVLITGNGDRSFCAGGDIRHVYEMGKAGDKNVVKFFWDEYRLNHLIHHYSKPYIAFLDGITMGGGIGVSIHGSHRIACEGAVLAMPETGIGFFPDIGGSYFLSRIPGNMGIYLGLSGARLAVSDAQFCGLIDTYMPRDQFSQLVDTLIHSDLLASGAITDIIEQFSVSPGEPSITEHAELIDTCFAANSIEDIMLQLEQHNNPWCRDTTKALMKKSPTSLKVALKQLQTGKTLDIDACLQMEYRLVNHFVQGHDFYEGVRALIIDKDNAPAWQPKHIDHVTSDEVDKYFAPLDTTELEF